MTPVISETGKVPSPPTNDFKRELLALLPSLRAFAISLCRNGTRADDLVQGTILKAWGNQTSFQPGTNMKAWLFTILRNEYFSQMRKAGREVSDPDDFFTNNLAVHPAQDGVMDLNDFKKALDTLPADQKEAIILIGASGFSYEEAAEIAGTAVGTMKSRVSRARLRMQEILNIKDVGEFGPDAASAPTVIRAFVER